MIMILDLTTLAIEVHHLGVLHGVWMESSRIIVQRPRNTEPINKQPDNTLSSITKRLFTPTKNTKGPNYKNTEPNNGGSRTPRFVRVEMDNDTAKRVNSLMNSIPQKVHRNNLKMLPWRIPINGKMAKQFAQICVKIARIHLWYAPQRPTLME